MTTLRASLFLFLLSGLVTPVRSQNTVASGPDSVDSLLEDGRRRHQSHLDKNLLETWDERKAAFAEQTGISWGSDYSFQTFGASGVPAGAQGAASSGMFRFYGKWEVLKPGEPSSGTLNWKLEHRHRYASTPASGFSLNSGNVGVIGPPFSDQQLRVTNLYWRQGIGDRVVAYVGFLDVTDFVDAWALASPWTGYTNLAFSTGAASMALPNDASLGAMLSGWLSDNVYLTGSIADMNSNPRDPFEGFNTFFNRNEYFKSLELGWTTAKDRFFADNVHLTLWHVDAVAATGTLDGWGVNFSAAHWVDDTWMPFVRAGWAEDGGSLLETSINAGVAMPAGKDSDDLFGAGVHWGRPNATTFGPGLGDQTSIELFYRAQVTQNFRLTPSLQLLFDPALNPAQDLVPVIGVRGVMTF
tara:strand:- start:1064 stop:2302 length:1239 start_codon:yes stop_codon:yes gene_type:complete